MHRLNMSLDIIFYIVTYKSLSVYSEKNSYNRRQPIGIKNSRNGRTSNQIDEPGSRCKRKHSTVLQIINGISNVDCGRKYTTILGVVYV